MEKLGHKAERIRKGIFWSFFSLFFLGIVLVMGTGRALGEGVLEPLITFSEHYDNNIRSTDNEPTSDYISTISPRLRVGYEWSLVGAFIIYRGNLRFYSENSGLNHYAQDAVVNFARVWMNTYNEENASIGRRGNRWGGRPGVGTFQCAPGGPDDYVYLIAYARRPRMWHSLLRAIGRDDLIEDPDFADPVNAAERTDEVNAMLEEWTSQRTKHEVMEILGAAGVPVSACLNAEDIYTDPHLLEREMIVSIDHPKRGNFLMPGCPIKLSDSPVKVTPAPMLGQHTDEVLSELLGFEQSELDEIRAEKVV